MIDSYLKNQSISIIEPKNYAHNPPRKFYLERIAWGLNLEIDYDSPLFEGRLNSSYGELYNGNNFAIYRLFRRLEESNRAGLVLSQENLKDFLMMGDVLFKEKYPQCVPLDP